MIKKINIADIFSSNYFVATMGDSIPKKRLMMDTIIEVFSEFGCYFNDESASLICETIFRNLPYEDDEKLLFFWVKHIARIMIESRIFSEQTYSKNCLQEIDVTDTKFFVNKFMYHRDTTDYINHPPEYKDGFEYLKSLESYQRHMKIVRSEYGVENYYPYGLKDDKESIKKEFGELGFHNINDESLEYINERINMCKYHPGVGPALAYTVAHTVDKCGLVKDSDDITKEFMEELIDCFENYLSADFSEDESEWYQNLLDKFVDGMVENSYIKG